MKTALTLSTALVVLVIMIPSFSKILLRTCTMCSALVYVLRIQWQTGFTRFVLFGSWILVVLLIEVDKLNDVR